jgi:hypothetical protein
MTEGIGATTPKGPESFINEMKSTLEREADSIKTATGRDITKAENTPEDAPSLTLESILKMRATLVTAMEVKEQEADALKKELATIDEAVCARFEAEGMTSAKIPGLGSFIMQRRTFASILPDRKVEAIGLFETHYPDLVQKTVNAQTLGAFWREAKKTGTEIPAEIVACVKESETKFIQWRR